MYGMNEGIVGGRRNLPCAELAVATSCSDLQVVINHESKHIAVRAMTGHMVMDAIALAT